MFDCQEEITAVFAGCPLDLDVRGQREDLPRRCLALFVGTQDRDAPCDHTVECVTGLVCVNGQCRDPQPEGEQCVEGEDCQSPLVCDETMVCVDAGGSGDACGPETCGSDLYCDVGGHCQPRLELSGRCEEGRDEQCLSNYCEPMDWFCADLDYCDSSQFSI
jgi:hypothetical protein